MRWLAILPYAAFLLTWGLLYLILTGIVPLAWKQARRFTIAAYPRVITWSRLGPVLERHEHRITAWRAYLPAILIFAGAVLMTSFLTEDFYDLAREMKNHGGVLQRVDQTANDIAYLMRSPAATAFFTFFTIIGSPVGLAVWVVLVMILLLVQRSRARMIYLAITSIAGGLLNEGLKEYFERDRPDLTAALRRAQGYSFPSGHSMGATIVLGAIAYVVWKSHLSWRITAALISLLATSIATIALSRVYLGVHWLSDIGAGVTAGIVWLTIMTAGFELTLRSRDLLRARRIQT